MIRLSQLFSQTIRDRLYYIITGEINYFFSGGFDQLTIVIFIFDTDFKERKYLAGVRMNFFTDRINFEFIVKLVFSVGYLDFS
jgi:hypothetical protein